jgi:hypothetical protein
MFGRNASRDAERAQDDADFGGEGGTSNWFPADADECGHVTFRLQNRAVAPSAGNPNLHAHLQDAIEGLYGTGMGMGMDVDEDEDEDKVRQQMGVDHQQDDELTVDEDEDQFVMVAAHATESNQQGLGQASGG